MKTKEEVIKEAWDNIDGSNKEVWASYWNYEKAKEHGIDESGGILVKGYDSFDGESFSYLRSISLQGIEDNNGWVKIESEKDLPNEYGFYWVYTIDCNIQLREKEDFLIRGKLNRYFTHYQPIIKPKKPLY